VVSSANDIGRVELFIVLGKSFMYKRNNNGPTTDPWNSVIYLFPYMKELSG